MGGISWVFIRGGLNYKVLGRCKVIVLNVLKENGKKIEDCRVDDIG